MDGLTEADGGVAFRVQSYTQAPAWYQYKLAKKTSVQKTALFKKSPVDFTDIQVSREFAISKDFLSLEPYGAMLRKDDPEFQKVADDATAELYKSGKINAIYDKWFMKPIPPKNITMNVPESEQLKKAFANPTHSGDPNVYK